MSEDTETLRRAAKLMRERAEVATPGPWWNESGVIHAPGWWQNAEPGSACHPAATDDGNGADAEGDAEHIASWHPAVALAVADMLETVAQDVGTSSLAFHAAAAVARTHLGEVQRVRRCGVSHARSDPAALRALADRIESE